MSLPPGHILPTDPAYALLGSIWDEMVAEGKHVTLSAWGDPETESYGLVCVARGEAARMILRFVDEDVPPFS